MEADIDLEAGIIPAEIGFLLLHKKPPAPRSSVRNLDVQHEVAWNVLLIERTAHIPHKSTRMEFIGHKLAARPPVAPIAQCVDDWPGLPSRLGWMVFPMPIIA